MTPNFEVLEVQITSNKVNCHFVASYRSLSTFATDIDHDLNVLTDIPVNLKTFVLNSSIHQ